MLIADLRRIGRRRLSGALNLSGDAAALEADVLLGAALSCSREQLMINNDCAIAADQAAVFHALLERRSAGEPVAYILGKKEFYSLSFAVDRTVLIPRPETEHLVDAGLQFLRQALQRSASFVVVDIGIGSGAVLLALMHELRREFGHSLLRRGSFIGLDISQSALATARRNAESLTLAPEVLLAASDVLSAVRLEPEQWDAILLLSNPPYIPLAEPLSPQIAGYEPESALRAGDKGLDVIIRLLEQSGPLLRRKAGESALIIEVGAGQHLEVESAAARLGLGECRFFEDLQQIKRIVEVRG